jgi:hypothetical protein
MSDKNFNSLVEKLKETSLGMGWVACLLCWPIAISLQDRFVVFLAGLVAIFAAYVGFSHRHRVGGLGLIVVSALEAFWLLEFAFSTPLWFFTAYSPDPTIDDSVKVMDALTRMIDVLKK